MPKIAIPLNDRQIKNAKPKANEFSLADGQGLYLRVRPNGTMQWIFKYTRPYTSCRTNMGLGVYPSTTLAEARQKRADARALLAKGIDPQENRNQLHSALMDAHTNTLERVAAR